MYIFSYIIMWVVVVFVYTKLVKKSDICRLGDCWV